MNKSYGSSRICNKLRIGCRLSQTSFVHAKHPFYWFNLVVTKLSQLQIGVWICQQL